MLRYGRRWIKDLLLNTQTRLVIFLSLSVFLLIIAVGFTSYSTSKDVLQDALNEPQQQMLKISMDYIDEYIEESDQVATKLALNSYIYQFLSEREQVSYDNIREIYEMLSTLIRNTSYIESIYVYDTKKESFVSMPQGYSSNPITFPDADWTGVADEFGDRMMLVKKRQVQNGLTSRLTLFRKVLLQGELRGIIAINIKQEELFSKLTLANNESTNSVRFILDGNQTMLYITPNPTLNDETLTQAIAQVKQGEFKDVQAQDSVFLAKQMTSDVTDWHYVSLVSQESILAKSTRIRNVVFSVSVLALLLGGGAIVYIHSVELRPIKRMKQMFHVKNKEVLRRDLLHLETLTMDLMSDHTQLSRVIQQVRSEASVKFLHDVYEGTIAREHELFQKWETYFPEWTEDSFVLAMLSIDNYSEWCERFPETYHSSLKFALANIVKEVLSSNGRVECADFGRDQMAVMFQNNSSTPVQQLLLPALTTIQELLGYSVSAGVGLEKQQIQLLRDGWLEANEALGKRLLYGYGGLYLYDKQAIAGDLPEDIDIESFMDVVESGEEGRALESLHQMIESFRMLPVSSVHLLPFLEQLVDALSQLQNNLSEQGARPSLKTMSLEDIEQLLKQIIHQIAEAQEKASQTKQYALCCQMVDYMEAHLGDPIGIPEVVQSVGISVSLGSQLFKKEMGDTIYGHLTQLRMKQAEEQLRLTEAKISEIASSVGYQHENSFIRVFRKYKQMTPGKYREMLRRNERLHSHNERISKEAAQWKDNASS
ncbi:AraC family transcriptional regulator [Aureibacillus halotolerans]|uniref:AraC-like DNA-binding protein n=1 Tax=Aureibacillus halotolerans TaxID=1508390 RepID=A0A4R6TZK7_9BACI|nr:AraC family transcriptional regulator [Aureibacillus halotolerans]TDQ38322.1 AraC-like DNA-binding protein [Aureibacillus halotolerans]